MAAELAVENGHDTEYILWPIVWTQIAHMFTILVRTLAHTTWLVINEVSICILLWGLRRLFLCWEKCLIVVAILVIS